MTWLGLVDQALTDYGYAAVAVGVGAECVGLPLPGETILLAAAAYAGATGHLAPALVVVVAAVAAVVGDNLGFALGRRYGSRLLLHARGRSDARGRALSTVSDMFARYGPVVVVAGRFVSVLRTYAALGAGATGMRWRTFLVLNVLGAGAWASLLGFAAAALGETFGMVAGYVVMGSVLLAALVAAIVLRRRAT